MLLLLLLLMLHFLSLFQKLFHIFYVVVVFAVAVVIVPFFMIIRVGVCLFFMNFSVCVFFASCRFDDAPLHMTMFLFCFYSKCSPPVPTAVVGICSNGRYICCFPSNPCRWFPPPPSSSPNSNHVSHDYSNLVVVVVAVTACMWLNVTFSLFHANTHTHTSIPYLWKKTSNKCIICNIVTSKFRLMYDVWLLLLIEGRCETNTHTHTLTEIAR